MASEVDRQRLADLLQQVRDGDDTEALAAARQAQAMLDESGATWHDVLLPVADDDEDDDALDLHDDADEMENTTVTANEGSKNRVGDDEALRLIDRMLAQHKDDEEFREELTGYKEDIAAGEFADRDRQYIRDLYERLRSA